MLFQSPPYFPLLHSHHALSKQYHNGGECPKSMPMPHQFNSEKRLEDFGF